MSDDQLDLPSAATTEPIVAAAWSKERGGGGLLYRTETRFGRIWQIADGRWCANRRPEPYIHKAPKWEGPTTFVDKKAAETWVEQGGST